MQECYREITKWEHTHAYTLTLHRSCVGFNDSVKIIKGTSLFEEQLKSQSTCKTCIISVHFLTVNDTTRWRANGFLRWMGILLDMIIPGWWFCSLIVYGQVRGVVVLTKAKSLFRIICSIREDSLWKRCGCIWLHIWGNHQNSSTYFNNRSSPSSSSCVPTQTNISSLAYWAFLWACELKKINIPKFQKS